MCICVTEAMAYSCFCQLMKRMSSNFPHGGAMDQHFANMRSLIQVRHMLRFMFSLILSDGLATYTQFSITISNTIHFKLYFRLGDIYLIIMYFNEL